MLTDTAVVGHLGTPQLGGLAVAGTLLTTGLWGALTLLMVARLVAVTGRFAGDRWAVTGPGR